MKKILIVGLSVLLLAACSDKSTTTEKKEAPKQEESVKQEVKAEVTNKQWYIWDDESVGNIPVLVTYAVIKNTGNVPVDISQTKLTYLDKNGDVLGTTNANELFINVSPSTISPGEHAYLAINQDVNETYKNMDDVTIEVNPFEVEKTNQLNPSKTKIIKTNDWGGSVSVTGFLNNNSDQDAAVIQASAGLYDKDNHFLGAVMLSSDDTTKIKTKGNSGIELGFPNFPSPKVKEVDHADIKAIGFSE